MADSREQELPLTVVGSSTFGRYNKISDRRVYNMYISDDWQVCYAGYKKVLQLEETISGRAEGRGFFTSSRGVLLVAVVNASVWSIDPQFGALLIGLLESATGPVFMDENLNSQIGIVDGISLYIYNKVGNSLTKQTGSLYNTLIPNYIRFHDTYFLIGNGNLTGDGAEFYALIFDTDTTVKVADGGQLALETEPDYALAAVPLSEKGDNILVFGKTVTEVQNNTPKINGDNVLLYQRVSTINISYGVLSVATIDSSDGMVIWLGINKSSPPVIMYFDGSEHHRISTDGIDYLLGKLNAPQKSFGFFFKRDGHLFYQLTFYDPSDNMSLFYDFNTQKIYNLCDWDFNYHPARSIVYFNNKTYFISIKDGCIYQMDTDLTTYDTNIYRKGNINYDEEKNHVIPRQIIGDTFRLDGVRTKPFFVRRVSIVMENGEDKDFSEIVLVGGNSQNIITEEDEDMITEDGNSFIVTENSSSFPSNDIVYTNVALGADYEPGVFFSYSRDGAASWSNEVLRRSNFIGKRQNIVKWIQGGRMNEFTPKFKFWGKSRFVVGNGTVEVVS